MRGDGSLIKRGKVWWLQYTQNGRTIRVSAQTTVKEEAKNRLKALVLKSRGDDNFFASLLPGRATISELVADLFIYYRTVKLKPKFAAECEMRWNKHLVSIFGDMQADRINSNDVLEYRAARSEAGAAPATINRELQVIHAALVLASEQDPPKVMRVPKFAWATEDNARQVFIDKEEESKLKEAASSRGLAQRVWIEMAFLYGWRVSELMSLTTENVNFVDGTIRLERTKNGDPREVPITNELRPLLQALLMNTKGRLFPFHPAREWPTLCKLAGLNRGKKGGITFHDIRRSSARNKRSAGVDTSIIMQLQGWNSDKMFRRYAIVDRGDMLSALEKEKASKVTVMTQLAPN
jgi:integrase